MLTQQPHTLVSSTDQVERDASCKCAHLGHARQPRMREYVVENDQPEFWPDILSASSHERAHGEFGQPAEADKVALADKVSVCVFTTKPCILP
jgi:hypothetical protein